MHAVIMAGGKGTRLSKVMPDIPKPMAPLHDQPILLHQIIKLKECGITDIILIIGHLGHVIKEYFHDGSEFGVHISYIEETLPLGTAGALYYLKSTIKEDFILLFGDVYCDIDFKRFVSFHKEKGGIATLFVHPNAHPYDSDLVICNEAMKIIGWDAKKKSRDYHYQNLVNAGIYIFSPEILQAVRQAEKLDLEKNIIMPFIENGQKNLYAYKSTEYVKDMGTPERLQGVAMDYEKGVCRSKNLKQLQKCVFLDRDGTINEHKGILRKAADFSLLPKVTEAIKKLNESNYLCIVITNQPVLARGECSVEELARIHKKMETLLGNAGCYLDDIYYCPHHPDRGFEGEVTALKIKCNCRKPAIGLISSAAEKYHIDLEKSFFIGDTTVDLKTAQNAGMRSILVATGEGGKDKKFAIEPNAKCKDLFAAVNLILGE